MKQQLTRSSMALVFQTTALIATTGALILTIPFIQTVAIPVIGAAIALNFLVNLYTAYEAHKTYKNF